MTRSEHKRITAIIPVAGLSSRMKVFKPLLPLGNATILASTISLFQTCGITDILVITGHRSGELEPVILDHHTTFLHNPDHKQGMFSTVLTGINALKPDCDAFFLLPADIPLVRPHTITAIQNAYIKGKGKIIYPVYNGERGHPPLISIDFLSEILNWKKDGGLQACLMQYEKDAYDVKVCDEGIHMDADTPDDYKRILEKNKRSDLPTTCECYCLLKQILNLDNAIINHCIKTSETADLLCRSLEVKQVNINPNLTKKAALLHDMARDKKNHAHSGSKILKEMGFERIADIIQNHMDITTDPDLPLNEKEIVFFADKLTVNDTLEIDYEKRFSEKAKAHKGNLTAENAIKKRFAATRIIHHKIEAVSKKKLSDILLLKG